MKDDTPLFDGDEIDIADVEMVLHLVTAAGAEEDRPFLSGEERGGGDDYPFQEDEPNTARREDDDADYDETEEEEAYEAESEQEGRRKGTSGKNGEEGGGTVEKKQNGRLLSLIILFEVSAFSLLAFKDETFDPGAFVTAGILLLILAGSYLLLNAAFKHLDGFCSSAYTRLFPWEW